MKKYTSQNKINAEMSVRDMNTNAFEAYSGSDYKVIEKNGKFDILINNEVICDQCSFAYLEDFFTEIYNECFGGDEDEE